MRSGRSHARGYARAQVVIGTYRLTSGRCGPRSRRAGGRGLGGHVRRLPAGRRSRAPRRRRRSRAGSARSPRRPCRPRPDAASPPRPGTARPGRTRPLRRSVAPADDSRIVPAYPGTSWSFGANASSSDRASPTASSTSITPSMSRSAMPVDVDGRQGVGARPVRRHADRPVRDGVDRAPRVAHDRPSQPDLLDRALDGAQLDDVALEVLALGQDQDPHQVVEDDALARERERGEDEAEAREHRPQVEHARGSR